MRQPTKFHSMRGEMMFNNIKKQMEFSLEGFKGLPNNQETRNKILNEAERVLNSNVMINERPQVVDANGDCYVLDGFDVKDSPSDPKAAVIYYKWKKI